LENIFLGAIGDGPRKATATALIQLVVKDGPTFIRISGDDGFYTINYDRHQLLDKERVAKLHTAGFCAALHIVLTHAGPHPISPILIFCSLQTGSSIDLMDRNFIGQFEAKTTADFFTKLEQTERRRHNGLNPVLLEFKLFFALKREKQAREVTIFACVLMDYSWRKLRRTISSVICHLFDSFYSEC
jgi:hypothetical protein